MPLDSAVDPNDNEGTLGCWFGIMWGKNGWSWIDHLVIYMWLLEVKTQVATKWQFSPGSDMRLLCTGTPAQDLADIEIRGMN